MDKIFAKQLSPLHETHRLLERFLALPEALGAANAEVIPGPEGRGVSFMLTTSDGCNLDWEAVLGGQRRAFLDEYRRWMLSQNEERTLALLYREGENAALIYRYYPYREILEQERWVIWREDLPLSEPRLSVSRNYNERSLEERIESARARYPAFWEKEASRPFRERHSREATPEALLEMGRVKGFWHPLEEEAVKRLLAK